MGRFSKSAAPAQPPALAERYVVDTNVLLAASAATPQVTRNNRESNFDSKPGANSDSKDITPQDPALRLRIWQWLDDFSTSESHLVLDLQGLIAEEYQHQLGFNDFGIQVLMHKWSTAAVDVVDLAYDADGYAVLPPELMQIIHDLSDRKFVAAALCAEETLGSSPIVFAGDTDWHDWESTLAASGITLLGLIEDWSRPTHKARQKPVPRHQADKHQTTEPHPNTTHSQDNTSGRHSSRLQIMERNRYE